MLALPIPLWLRFSAWSLDVASHFCSVWNPGIFILNILSFSYSSPQSKITLIIYFFFSQPAKLSRRKSQGPVDWFHCKFMLALISPRSCFSMKKKNPSFINSRLHSFRGCARSSHFLHFQSVSFQQTAFFHRRDEGYPHPGLLPSASV